MKRASSLEQDAEKNHAFSLNLSSDLHTESERVCVNEHLQQNRSCIRLIFYLWLYRILHAIS